MTRVNWLAAFSAAVFCHMALVLAYVTQATPLAGAKEKGLTGIEINLGLLGNLAEKQPEKINRPPEPKSKTKAQQKQKRVEKPVKPITKPKPQAEIKEVIKPSQKTEVLVKTPIPTQMDEVVLPALAPPESVEASSDFSEATKTETVTETLYQSSSDEVPIETTGVGQQASTGGKVAAQVQYSGLVFAKLKKYKRYPKFSKRRHEEGVVKLSFFLDRNGNVMSSKITQSSGYENLDKEVLRMLKLANPFPPFPSDLNQETLEVSMPVSFYLK